ncbi:hypothetical protein [Nocardioides alcanivorans]|uniref:hypothetical protein n=1 Tax=Nocardioides alcanivorans TaxID=2897352 RepID=UPI001F43A57D|nr:hypothetical protein [Nocardioides alcanivorans]
MVSAEQQASVHDNVKPFSVLQTLLLATEGIEGFLRELAMATTDLIDESMSCGITTEDQGVPLTVASSDDRASALDDAQYRLDEGPCLHAMRAAEVVDLAEIGAAARWPAFLAEARRQGLRSSLSLP